MSDLEPEPQPEVADIIKVIKNKKQKKMKRAHKRRREALKQKARAWNTTKGLLCCCGSLLKTKVSKKKWQTTFEVQKFSVDWSV